MKKFCWEGSNLYASFMVHQLFSPFMVRNSLNDDTFNGLFIRVRSVVQRLYKKVKKGILRG